MIKIICIKWGNKYSPEYVNRLFRGIQRNTSKEFSFICFTDDKTGLVPGIEVKDIPFPTGDWYAKIGLYNKDLYNPDDQIFFLDLDTIIIRNMDNILEYSGDFAILRDPYNKKGFGSGFMSWRPEAVDFMWKKYTRGTKHTRGDQYWPELHYPNADIWQEMYPGQIISYKANIRDRVQCMANRNFPKLPGDITTASIVYFHGRPNPHELTNLDWVKENWK